MGHSLHRLLATSVVTLALVGGGVGCSTSTAPSETPTVRAETRDATVLITTYEGDTTSWAGRGSGSVLTPNGIVLTNNHVILGAITIEAQVGEEVYDATVMATFPTRDVALIQLEGAENLPVVTIGDSDTVGVGDEVTSYGNSEGIDRVVVLHGTVTALDQPVTIYEDDLTEFLLGTIEVSERVIYSGNSGGPLTNADDEVIGMNTAGADIGSTGTVGNAIPINQVMVLIRSYL